MADMFYPAIAIVFPEEGKYSLQVGDPGGETKWGTARNEHPEITADKWARWSKDDSINLFHENYWIPHRCAEMPWRWALGVFDGEINQGSVIKLAQRALGCTVDGVVGPQLLAAMGKSNDWQFANFMARRAKAYIPLPLFPNDGDGWFTRIAQICYYAGKEPAQG